ncbi:hypothetical protein STEG23_005953, partial [Scotinomys teguina]
MQMRENAEEWIRKMWYIYTMEYYAAEKNNDIMKFAGKWMELENVILSECQLLSCGCHQSSQGPQISSIAQPLGAGVDTCVWKTKQTPLRQRCAGWKNPHLCFTALWVEIGCENEARP